MIDKKRNKDYWESIPGDIYWKSHKTAILPERRFHETKVKQTIRELPKGELKILDVGCGSGDVIAKMASMGHVCTGIDVSKSFLKWCQFVKTKENIPASFVLCDSGHLPLQNDTYDVVVCTEVIRHLANPEKNLDEIHRVLRKDGILLLSTPINSAFWKFTYGLWMRIGRRPRAPICNWWTIDEIRDLLNKSSFGILNMKRLFYGFTMLVKCRPR